MDMLRESLFRNLDYINSNACNNGSTCDIYIWSYDGLLYKNVDLIPYHIKVFFITPP